MLRVSDALKSLIRENQVLQLGLQTRLLNLSQVAKFLRPQIAARTKKEVTEAAILMNLSRMQRAAAGKPQALDLDIRVDNLSVHSDLVVVCYSKTREVHQRVHSLYGRIQRRGGYITITEGTKEVTVIIEQSNHKLLDDTISTAPIYKHTDVASLGITFSKGYLDTPGLYYFFFQQLYFQNINIVEIASTATELIFYLPQTQVQLAFETMYQRFALRRRESVW